ncbi:MAG: DEAD/DEAH box helicase [Elusimicrobia bacterium]|nr:DEAD/DEAH box helicase [Elusimicrobiota bacterium]
MSFESLSLHPTLVKATAALGYTEPTPIQAKAIPLALSGRDVLGAAQTGGGKTAAFVLPILHGLLTKPGPGPRVLILVPTRELAVQVDRVIKECSRFSPVKTAVIIGGVGHSGQTHAVRQGAQILVATPGRLMDHLEQKNFQLHRIDQLVLDEADRMLDMGFLPDIKDILKHVPPERQTQLYSATLHKDVERIASFALRDPARVEVEKPATVAEGISQIAYPVIQSQKIPLLLTLLNSTEMRSVLVFTRTKHGADKVAQRLTECGYRTGVLHSNRSQNQRQAAMDDFRHARTRLLVATDIAARGIDVKGISHVVNFDVPRHAEDYVHRVGRTARAYGVGDAILLVDPSEESFVRGIERYARIVFPRAMIPNFQYNNPPRGGGAPAGRSGRSPFSSHKGTSHSPHKGSSHPNARHPGNRPPRGPFRRHK